MGPAKWANDVMPQPLTDAVIHVYDEPGNVIETHEHAGGVQRTFCDAAREAARAGLNPVAA